MPGRTEQHAVTSFLDPLRKAVSVLAGHNQITVSRRGTYRKGLLYAWELNSGAGTSWADVGTFTASMNFEIVDTDPARHDTGEGPFRVTTRGYWYTFRDPNGTHLWRMHWHPEGNSSVTGPHLHRPPDLKRHWSTPRLSFETAIEWCVTSGAPTSCDSVEMADRLIETESAYKLYGSWQQTSDPGYPYSTKPSR
ncbi:MULTISPECIES: hypothetical protein [Pseudonocardia]|uniref:Uncharacterized protein n=2 Tax=Pseudonocardia TaxID=1847 RepID=A0A1Y2N355_PSEAH|nr:MULTISPECIES: hypothetical protein [Pseudonocardia]OSY41870.1 hypothetical protein BG845_01899 [Pseudonocardia autotrophica]TDN71078.1 hypothetical protein C8E95_0104 [Pseudonocardia autotrophica]BBG01748.1 hypothetical protein Pdca_29570 [Pseudonocardia autotrophica]GEC26303.1 hypothetical protein PSA01_33320 [Pseudonocardia saturnea]